MSQETETIEQLQSEVAILREKNRLLSEENAYLLQLGIKDEKPAVKQGIAPAAFNSALDEFEALLGEQVSRVKRSSEDQTALTGIVVSALKLLERQASTLEELKEAVASYLEGASPEPLAKFGIDAPENRSDAAAVDPKQLVEDCPLEFDTEEVIGVLNELQARKPPPTVYSRASKLIAQQIHSLKTVTRELREEQYRYGHIVALCLQYFDGVESGPELEKCKTNLRRWTKERGTSIDPYQEIDFALGLLPVGPSTTANAGWEESLKKQLGDLKKEVIQMQNKLARDNKERRQFIRKYMPKDVDAEASWCSIAKYLLP